MSGLVIEREEICITNFQHKGYTQVHHMGNVKRKSKIDLIRVRGDMLRDVYEEKTVKGIGGEMPDYIVVLP